MADPTIRVKRSSVAGRVPSVNQVPLGELALNTYDGQLYASKNVGLGTTVVVINPWIVGTGTDSYNAFFIAGNAGIGTTTPGSKLTVSGDGSFTGIVTVSSLRGYNSLVGAASSITTTFVVTVASKTSNHRYFGTGSGSAYFIDGIESPFITLLPGKTYRFTQEDGSNGSHPVLFYYTADKTTQYTTNVTTNGTPGSAGAYTQIVVTDTTPVVLHYQCSNHGYMGNAAHFSSNVVDTPYQITARSGINVTGVTTSSSGFSGALTGNVTGNVTGNLTGTADNVTTNANLTGDVTSIGNATTLATVNSNVGTFGSGGAIPSITVNAKGLVTGITTNAVSTANDGTLTLAVSGTGLSGSASFTANQSGSSSFTVASNATNNNTNNTIVSRDGAGSFVAGIITATSFVGDGSGLTGVTASGTGIVIKDNGNIVGTAGTVDFGDNLNVTPIFAGIVTVVGAAPSQFVTTNAGIHTLSSVGIGSTNPTAKLTVVGSVLVSGAVTATSFSGDGSGLTGVIASGTGIVIKDNGNIVGTAGTIDFGDNLNVSPIFAGIVTVTSSGGGGGTIGISSAGNRIGTGFTDLNFIGTGVSIVGSGSTVSIRIEPGLVGAAKSVTSFTATTSQTTFNVNYSQGQENIFLNGVRLSESQYTATNGSTVVLNDPATNGDSVDIIVYLRGSDPNRNTMVTLLPPFNGATTAFTMFQGTTSYLFEPIDERQIVVSLGGVIQQPGVAYTVGTGSSIFFSAAPGIAVSCFITALFSNTVGIPTDAVKLNKQTYSPSGIQTSFTVTDGYRSGYLEVYRNGLRLVDGSDFTASNGTTFSLITPANGGDVVDIVVYKTLNIQYAEFAGLSTNVDGGYGSLTNLQVSGISTLGNVLIGVGGTDLLVKGNARVTGILTIGQGSITLNGLTDTISGSTFLNSTNLSISGVGTISNGSITNLTGTSSTITTFRSTTLNADTGNIVTGVTTNFTSTNATITNLTGTAGTVTTLRSTTGNFTTGNIVTGVTTNFNAANVIITGVTTVSAGTALLPSISPSGDPNTGIFFPAADTLAAVTAGSNRLHITSGGLVGIGSITPNATLQVDASGGGAIRILRSSVGANYVQFEHDGTNGTITSNGSTGNLLFNVNSSERARINFNGNLLVGTVVEVSGSNHIVVGSNSIQGVKKTFTNLSTTVQGFGFQATNASVYVAHLQSVSTASVAFLIACVYDPGVGIIMATTALGRCTAGGDAATISGIYGDARTYTFQRDAGTGEFTVTASTVATGSTVISLTPLNVFL